MSMNTKSDFQNFFTLMHIFEYLLVLMNQKSLQSKKFYHFLKKKKIFNFDIGFYEFALNNYYFVLGFLSRYG